MDVREALYTTRAMRRVKPDPIPEDVQSRIVDAAIRAPTGGNSQAWRFVLVDDKEQIARIGELYRECIDLLWEHVYADRVADANSNDSDESRQFRRIIESVNWAQENFATYPLLLFAFDRNDPSGGSIFPAVWSAMLQARADGVGSSLTSVLLFKNDETFEVLGVPADKGWRMACCVPFGYPTGNWGVAKRRPAHEVTYRNRWGAPMGTEIDEPLWP
ncbi:MAG: nitroreductase family protein [Actinobacteria bacterium]|nr:nitroreductase family protein [Actinomycetota bacterium]NIS30133.1 nitroreductase family protein [Actinomycetota bacterium]NIT94881.1 nitroreductase family protein [Actinomycetota bacterium]NIU18536.1 nitroreductase family protein [Actinomycetota bacterium]NIU65387.1 nitroreductase family protein [Actinomycetota bacterium]